MLVESKTTTGGTALLKKVTRSLLSDVSPQCKMNFRFEFGSLPKPDPDTFSNEDIAEVRFTDLAIIHSDGLPEELVEGEKKSS